MRRRARFLGWLSSGLFSLLAACSAGSAGGGAGGGGDGGGDGVALPTANVTFDYQIGGAYPPAAAVAIVDRDRADEPVPGKYNVCYVNAFQTQPGEDAWWRENHGGLLLKRDGVEVVDPNWPGEIVLDLSTPAKRDQLAAIVGEWIDRCAAAGFDAVEPDNLDSWTRSKGAFTQADAVAFATLLAARAHAAGLAIAQKNTSELAPLRAQIGFDFAIVEECQPWGDCDDFTDAYRSRWFEIEYSDREGGGVPNFQAACAARGGSISVLYRDRDVVPAGAAGYVYDHC